MLIILGISLVILVAIALVIHIVKVKLEDLSMELFHTRSLQEVIDRGEEQLAETPKSVASMTRIYEPQIAKDFPNFNWVEFKNKAEVMLESAFLAISKSDLGVLGDVSSDIKEKLRIQIEKNNVDGQVERYEGIQVHQTEITNYEKKSGKCIITLQSAVEHVHYIEKNGSIIEGTNQRPEQTKYNVELMYIQDAEKANMDKGVGVTCPNCGAPVTNLGRKYCEYCGGEITVINIQVWTLQNYYEVTSQKL